jgi:hypothetical protein
MSIEASFQQDGATCHTSNASMTEIESYFGDRLITKNLWPPRSPDLTPPGFFLWGLLKGRACIREIESSFGDQLRSKNLGPPRTPDLAPPDFFLWGLLKGRVFGKLKVISVTS